jgi:hypothetical protein
MIKRLLIFVLVLVFLGVISVYWEGFTGKVIKDFDVEEAIVLRVIDGDTIVTDVGKVRLLGINTPEKGREYYNEALVYLKEIENKSVELLRDEIDLDKYDRKLRYVFYDGRLINVEILERGLGTSLLTDGLMYEDKLMAGEYFSRGSKFGLWEKSNKLCSKCIKLLELNPEEEFFILDNICEVDCNLDEWYVKDNANHFIELDEIKGYSSVKYWSKGKIWNNDGDRFFMRDSDGKLAGFYEY